MDIKVVAAQVLKTVGLFDLTRKTMIRLGLHVPTPHGHCLLLKALDEKETKIGSLPNFANCGIESIGGAEITNEACYRMHLDCATEAVRLMGTGGVIVFDDAWRQGDGWGGKGHSALPFLLDHGFSVIQETRNTFWLERQSV
jgi:hypothetical protein